MKTEPASITRRNFSLYAGAALAVIVLGLASRRVPGILPACLGKYPGDALWALMVFFGWGMILPRLATGRLAVLALATSYAVEFSQLYQAPWLNAIRGTTLGHLVLGSGFDGRDFAAYAVGVAVGVLCDRLFRRLKDRRRPPQPSQRAALP